MHGMVISVPVRKIMVIHDINTAPSRIFALDIFLAGLVQFIYPLANSPTVTIGHKKRALRYAFGIFRDVRVY